MKKVLKITIITIIVLLTYFNCVNAKEGQSMNLTLSSNKNSYEVGDEITIDVIIEEIKGFPGINTFAAMKVYDKEYLEYIGTTVANSNWEVIGDGTNILLRKMEGDDLQKGKLCTLKFKILKSGNTVVQLSQVDACSNDGDVYYEDNNVNSPSVEINMQEITKNNSGNELEKSYLGIILIVAGILGLIILVIHYIINKNKY